MTSVLTKRMRLRSVAVVFVLFIRADERPGAVTRVVFEKNPKIKPEGETVTPPPERWRAHVFL